MLVYVQRGPGVSGEGLSGAETRVVGQWRSWTGKYAVPGLALVNVNVPDGRGRVRQVDALLFFPHGLVVVEIKGFTEPQSGTLRVPLNGPLTLDEQPAALHTLSTESPLEQLKGALFATKNTLRTAEIDPGFVTGWLVLVPQPKTTVTIGDTSNTDRGFEVVLDDNKGLRRVMHQLRRRNSGPVWSADRVLQACRALDLLTLAPAREELLADGFPATVTIPASPSSTPATPPRVATSAPTRTGPTVTPRKTSPMPVTRRAPATAREKPVPATAPPTSPLPARPPRPSRPRVPAASGRPLPAVRLRRWPTVLAFALIIILGTIACVVVYQAFHGH